MLEPHCFTASLSNLQHVSSLCTQPKFVYHCFLHSITNFEPSKRNLHNVSIIQPPATVKLFCARHLSDQNTQNQEANNARADTNAESEEAQTEEHTAEELKERIELLQKQLKDTRLRLIHSIADVKAAKEAANTARADGKRALAVDTCEALDNLAFAVASMIRFSRDVHNKMEAEKVKPEVDKAAVVVPSHIPLVGEKKDEAKPAPEVKPDILSAFESCVQGLQFITIDFITKLESHGITRMAIKPGETKFDPNFHQAVASIPNSGATVGVILAVIRPGFNLTRGDSTILLRPAQVVVASDAKESSQMSTSEPKQ